MLKNFLILSGFSTFVVAVYIGLNIFLSSKDSTLPIKTQTQINTIPSTFDTKTLNSLKKRVPISVDLQEKSNVLSDSKTKTLTTPSPTDIPQPASPSAKTIIVPTLP